MWIQLTGFVWGWGGGVYMCLCMILCVRTSVCISLLWYVPYLWHILHELIVLVEVLILWCLSSFFTYFLLCARWHYNFPNGMNKVFCILYIYNRNSAFITISWSCVHLKQLKLKQVNRLLPQSESGSSVLLWREWTLHSGAQPRGIQTSPLSGLSHQHAGVLSPYLPRPRRLQLHVRRAAVPQTRQHCV